MTRNWIRACNLIVSGSKGFKDLASLRVVFSIKQWSLQAPNMASFRVYNPAFETVKALKAKEFTKVEFYAGYQGNEGLVFSGEIKQTRSGHETAVDSFVDLFCADGETGYNQARVTKTLAAGWTPQDKLNVAMDAFKPFGITLGLNALDLSQPKAPRGLPLIGMARDIVRQVVMSKAGVWSIQQGKVKAVPKSLETGQSDTVTMNGHTGMIGWPEQTEDGIKVRSLLNPKLQPLMKLKIDPSAILEAEQNNNTQQTTQGQQLNQTLIQQQLGAGTYTIFHLDRFGDSRGAEWFDESTCIGLGGSLPESQRGYSLGFS